MKGPVAYLAQSIGSLLLGTVLLLGSMNGLALWSAKYIRHTSDSPSTDMLLITGWMLMTFFAAYVAAIAVGHLIFGSVWRETTFLGRRLDAATDSLDELQNAARNRTLHFSVLVVVLIGLFSFTTHWSTDGFLSWYSKYGYATSVLRGDDTKEKERILHEMTQAQDSRLVGNTKLMVGQLDSDDDAVALQALWSVGEVARRTARSIEMMENGADGGEWVYGLQRYLQSEVRPALDRRLPALKTGGPEASALVYAVTALQSKSGYKAIRKAIEQGAGDDEMIHQVVLAVGEQRNLELIGSVLTLLDSEQADHVTLTAYAVGRVFGMDTTDYSMVCARSTGALRIRCGRLEEAMERSTRGFEGALKRFDPTTEQGVQVHCAIFDAIQRTRAPEISGALIAAFNDIQPADRRCPRQAVQQPFQGEELHSAPEEYREKVVKTMASIAQGNDVIETWLTERSTDPAVASGIRADMQHILTVIEERAAR